MSGVDGMSYATIHRLAVREARRVELGRALDEVRRATHVVATLPRRGSKRQVWCIGDRRTCEAFAADIGTGYRVEPITDADRERESVRLCAVYRR